MTSEFDIGGVFLSSVVPTAIIGLFATILLRRLLAKLGLYRFVWHPALFDSAIFLILWAVVVGLSFKV